MDFVAQQHWDKSYENVSFAKPSLDDFLRNALLQFIPKSKNGNAIEVGCYPGGYLSVLGDLGYTLHGIDLTPKTYLLQELLTAEGYKVGRIDEVDFLKFKSDLKYDVVTSFGFIEHFENYKEIILRHADLVIDGGYLVISAPNFKGFFQKMFHLICDTPNLKRHNLTSMNPSEWSNILTNAGFEILFSGYGGGAQFWMHEDQTFLQRFLGRSFLFIHKWLGKLFHLKYDQWNHPSIACDCLLVARRV